MSRAHTEWAKDRTWKAYVVVGIGCVDGYACFRGAGQYLSFNRKAEARKVAKRIGGRVETRYLCQRPPFRTV